MTFFLAGAERVAERAQRQETMDTSQTGGVRTTIAKHHERYSKSDHLCEDGVE